MHVGIATNNIAELEAVRQGLVMAWNMGVNSSGTRLQSGPKLANKFKLKLSH